MSRTTRLIFFKKILTGLNSALSFFTSCYTKVKETSLPYYFPISGKGMVESTHFLRVLLLYKMQAARSWT